MTIHMTAPKKAQSYPLFEVKLVSATRIAIRQRTEGPVYVFAFDQAHAALATLKVNESSSARYSPAYFEEEAWRFADGAARRMGLLCPTQPAA